MMEENDNLWIDPGKRVDVRSQGYLIVIISQSKFLERI